MATLLTSPGYWLQRLIEFKKGVVVLATAACLWGGCEISSNYTTANKRLVVYTLPHTAYGDGFLWSLLCQSIWFCLHGWLWGPQRKGFGGIPNTKKRSSFPKSWIYNNANYNFELPAQTNHYDCSLTSDIGHYQILGLNCNPHVQLDHGPYQTNGKAIYWIPCTTAIHTVQIASNSLCCWTNDTTKCPIHCNGR